mmetsp:Transcript_75107/g.208888  ORF Transcript_75107/g.208888 Transcript_75107/m.208888 type:complete len:282 (+) Transcript_75107:109-954(+)
MKLGTQSIRSKSGIRIATVSTDRCSPDHQGEQRYCVCGSPSAVSFPHTIGNQRRPVSADRTNRDLPSTSRPRSTTGPEAWRPNWAKNGKSPTVTVVSILTGPSGPSPMARRSEASWTRTGLPPKPATTLPVSRNSAGPKPSAAATATLQSVATAPISTTPMHLTEVEALRPPGHSCSSTVRTSGPPACCRNSCLPRSNVDIPIKARDEIEADDASNADGNRKRLRCQHERQRTATQRPQVGIRNRYEAHARLRAHRSSRPGGHAHVLRLQCRSHALHDERV